MKHLIAIILFIATLSAFTAPQVTDVVAKQRYPWNGLVDITCKVSGIDATVKDRQFSVAVVFPGSGNVQSVWHFGIIRDGINLAKRDVESNGDYHLLWNAKSDLGLVRYTNMVVRVSVGKSKVQLWEGGPYWATTNVGAETPWDYGYYFWWGDTVGYKRENNAWVASDGSHSNFSFRSENTPTYNKRTSTLQSEGWITSDGVLAPEHDAAQAHWGGNWRMPTKTELENLNSMCTWTWTATNGVNGYVVRGKDEFASASIFLPAAGHGYGTSLYSAGSRGSYWSSVPYSDYDCAWFLYCLSSDHYVSYSSRYSGLSVRAVQGFTK